MQYSIGTKELGLPDIFRFGIELEAFNVSTIGRKSLYYSPASKEFLKRHRWKIANFLEESLVMEGGAECVSPILYDKEEDWQNLTEVCEHMKKFPGKHGKEVIADKKCGCHIHFDARILQGRDENETESIKANFLRLWAEAEELIYKMCNEENDSIREGSINLKSKGIIKLASQLQGIKGMAMPSGKKIMKAIEKGTLKLSTHKFGIMKRIIAKGKLDTRRYYGLNLTNIGNPNKNTLEFRISNGTLNPEVIKQNLYLDACLLQTSRRMALEPEKVQAKVEEFYKTDVTEEQKVDALLNLIFENSEDKQIYKTRWQSVKDAPVFAKNDQKDFAQGRFKRENFQEIAKKTPVERVKQAFSELKIMRKENELEGERE